MKIAAFNLSGQGSFAQDKPALADAIKTSGADVVLLPGTSRVRRAVGAAALCAGAEVDTNVVDLAIDGEAVTAQRWLYIQSWNTSHTQHQTAGLGSDTDFLQLVSSTEE